MKYWPTATGIFHEKPTDREAATKGATGCYETGLTCNEAYVFGGRSLQGFCAIQDAFS
jgi:hypothetical protein